METSPETLVEALIRAAPQLPPQKLQEFGVQLQHAGFSVTRAASSSEAPTPELVKLLSLPAGKAVDQRRAGQLIALLGDFYVLLETLVWSVWQQVSPQSRFRRETGGPDVKRLSAAFLTGEAGVTLEQIGQLLDKTRLLSAGLLGAAGGAGRTFAERFASEFAPDNLMALAKTDAELGKIGMSAKDEARGWRKFKKLFQMMNEDAIEDRLRTAIAHQAENLIRGTRHETAVTTPATP
jgi:hypothetical protein